MALSGRRDSRDPEPGPGLHPLEAAASGASPAWTAATDGTIAAISSPPGPAAASMIRLSGPDAAACAARFIRLSGDAEVASVAGMAGFRQASGWLDWDGLEVPVRVAMFRKPRSFTGEDLVELAIPGSPPLAEEILGRLAASGRGMRLARPGEFTLRAFLNGRLDLLQAEAIGRLIHAAGEAEAQAAFRRTGGSFSSSLRELESRLLELLGLIEAAIDFPDEGIPAIAPGTLAAKGEEIRGALEGLLRCTALRLAERGHWRVVLLGFPNAGKSSLLNALAGRPAALVSDRAGTTRDPVRAAARCGSWRIEWIDLAGLEATTWSLAPGRQPEGPDPAGPFQAAIGRISAAELEAADGILWVHDAGSASAGESWEAWEALGKDTRWRGKLRTAVISKADTLDAAARSLWLRRDAVLTSAHTGEGLEALRQHVKRDAAGTGNGAAPRPLPAANAPGITAGSDAGAILVSPRERSRLEGCLQALGRSIAQLSSAGAGFELAAADCREAIGSLALLTGREVSELVLGEIFGRFCIGK